MIFQLSLHILKPSGNVTYTSDWRIGFRVGLNVVVELKVSMGCCEANFRFQPVFAGLSIETSSSTLIEIISAIIFGSKMNKILRCS